ncbi:MAG: hypothetical protein WED04_09640 [Promethearchaeati archaeon SRVP18_Atabeyarchaeia-1]
MSEAELPSKALGRDSVLAYLREMEGRIMQRIQELKQPTANPNVTLGDESIINKGQKNKAENSIEKWFEQLSGDVIAELDFIDKTTFGYLDSIPKSSGIRIITSAIKDLNKCLRNAETCARDRPHFEISKINKVHERWIGSKESFFIDIGADLKRDALGNSTHTIRKFSPEAFKESISHFESLWTKNQEELRMMYGNDWEKSILYQRRRR